VKAAPFEYSRPATVDEACAMLAADDGARLIAGGQTLVPLMAMRLARPSRLVDIARIPELAYIRDEGNAVAIGATTRQATVETDTIVGEKVSMLAKAIQFVGHTATRARGTIGGSIANADSAAEIALVAVTLGAALSYRDGGETTQIPANEFFVGPMTTVLPYTAVLTEVRLPVWKDARIGIGFQEVNARASDFAFASAAAQIAVGNDGRCTRIALGVGGAYAFPIQIDVSALVGTKADDKAVREVVTAALSAHEAIGDAHASADYRRRAAHTMCIRAIAEAYANAR
jgi:CO/xanthine dehydrogenase FAD-binding subunit